MNDQLRVLLIEDDPVDHQLISRSLQRSRRSVELAWHRSLANGVQCLAEDEFDVVLTDLSLPDSFGLDTVIRIRNQNQDVPIIVLTTLDDEQIEASSLTAGAQDYFIKDEASPHTLERAIHHAIQRQESVAENQALLAKVESSRKRLREQKELLRKKNIRLRKLYRTAHRFVDNVSHEFRTPLTVIKDYVSLVREGLVGEVNNEQRRMLDVASVRADDLNNMVDDMLDVSKLKSGLIGAWRRPCQLGEIVESVCPPLARKASLKDIEFNVKLPNSLPEVYCDAEKIGRVIINLVTNGMKFCSQPGLVSIDASQDESRGEVVIRVSDNGPGIDEEGISQIFKRFKQLKANPESTSKGFGLGLSIAKELVELNFGRMGVESRLGEGTTFSFTLPVNDPLGIFGRYLERFHNSKSGGVGVSLIAVHLSEASSQPEADDTDSFFNYLLRRDDLLFRAGPRRWLFVLSSSTLEVPEFLSRVETEWEKTNRNRPFGPLPQFEMSVQGTWDTESDSDVIVEAFQEAFQSQPVCV